MGKYTSLLIKSFVLIFLVVIFADQRLPANEDTKAKDLKDGEGKDWIELLKEEIREVAKKYLMPNQRVVLDYLPGDDNNKTIIE